MMLVLAILAFLAGIGWWLLVQFAIGMSTTGTTTIGSNWGGLVACWIVAACFALVHFVGV